MVQTRQLHPLHQNTAADIHQWIASIDVELSEEQSERLVKAAEFAQAAMDNHPIHPNPYAWSADYNPLNVGLEMASILASLHVDDDTLVAAILYRVVREERVSTADVEAEFGELVASLLDNVLNMVHINLVRDYDQAVLGQSETQSDAVRKMLVAMLDDVRVVLIKLSERCCALRLGKHDREKAILLAREASQIYIPLAHRLGIGQLKWELEDLAFRYLEPNAYQHIASQLSEKRVDRQVYIEKLIQRLQDTLEDVGLDAQVTGRVKHIFSIWKKMKRKNVGFSELYDIRAVRILVPEVKDCYVALGMVHSLWPNISKEFDDYIAQPKDNGYRSLHTAVIGPEDKVVEVQIRTFDMHQEAELGVCAHWVYKGVDGSKAPSSYEEKLRWFRQAIDSYEYEDALNVFASELKTGLKDNRIYSFTPDGHVIELRKGATPLDFAYRVHTEVGHGCRGAKVNGRIVPLSYELNTGDQVEIIVEKGGTPNSEWLRNDLHYVGTARARLKIKAWFRQRDREQSVEAGKHMLEKELKRMAITNIAHKTLAETFKSPSLEEFYAQIGMGEISIAQLIHNAQSLLQPQKVPEQESMELELVTTDKQKSSGQAEIQIQGIGNLLTVMASCCKPVPGDAIRGFVTQSRGVSIHRQDCAQLLALENQEPERVLDVSWGYEQKQNTFEVDVFIEAYDRTGLIRDISTQLANEYINVTAMTSQNVKDGGMVHISLTLEVSSLKRLSAVLARLNRLSNIINVERAKV